MIPRDTSPSTNGSTDQDAYDLEHFVDAFEEEISEVAGARLEDFLPPTSHPEYEQIVVELLRVDLEHRWQSDQPRSLEDYRERFPAIFQQPSLAEPIAFEEYRLRCQSGGRPSVAEYARRFRISTSDWEQRVPTCAEGSRSPTDIDAYPLAGDSLLDFHVIAEFAQGSFSRIYLARQGDLAHRLVVLKASKQMWAESAALATLQHTNIVPIHSVHRHGEIQYHLHAVLRYLHAGRRVA